MYVVEVQSASIKIRKHHVYNVTMTTRVDYMTLTVTAGVSLVFATDEKLKGKGVRAKRMSYSGRWESNSILPVL